MAKHYIIKKTKKTILVKDYSLVSEEGKADIKRYEELGWTVKPCKVKEKKEEYVPHEVTKEFDIDYDIVRKEDMYNYIKNFVEDPKAMEKFATESHKKTNGEPSLTKKGEPKYNQIAAKKYFFKTYFPEKWTKIEEMLSNRKFKSKPKEEQEKKKIEDELKALLKNKK